MLEAPFAWASDATATLSARLRLPLLRRALRVGVTVRRPQVSAHARVAARPLLEEWPYAGSVSVTLMAPPHVDFELPIRLPAFLAPPGAGGGKGAPALECLRAGCDPAVARWGCASARLRRPAVHRPHPQARLRGIAKRAPFQPPHKALLPRPPPHPIPKPPQTACIRGPARAV